MSLFWQLPTLNIRRRVVASLVHFSISVVIISAVFAVIYWIWFPHALISASGGLDGLIIIAGVDITLGPLLTLLVYDPVTKRPPVLVRDLAVIATLQLASLAAGVVIVHHARPLAIVHLYNTFHVLRQQDFEAFKIDWHPLENLPGTYPKIFYVKSEKNDAAFIAKQVLDGLNKATPQYLRIDLYHAIPQHSEQIKLILRQSITGNSASCILQNIESAYVSGQICFHPDQFIFTNFIPGKSISYIETGVPEP